MRSFGRIITILGMILWSRYAFADNEFNADAWIARQTFIAPPVGERPISGGSTRLPVLTLDKSTSPGILRVSVPFSPGAFPAGKGIEVNLGESVVPAQVRVLTQHPDTTHSVRRALLTFPYEPLGDQPDQYPRVATLRLTDTPPVAAPSHRPGDFSGEIGGYRIHIDGGRVRLTTAEGKGWTATAIAPDRSADMPVTTEIVEAGPYYLWVRLLAPDPEFPRIIEVQIDSRGRAAIIGRWQRIADADGTAPDLGWILAAGEEAAPAAEGKGYAWGDYRVLFPEREDLKRGEVTLESTPSRLVAYRCHASEKVPMQPFSWRNARVIIAPISEAADADREKEPVHIAPEGFDAIYHCGVSPVLDTSVEEIRYFHQWAMGEASVKGDDYGNITSIPNAGLFGMNRLNHCPAIFEEYYRSGYAPIRAAALKWCDNFYDLTIWWGTKPEGNFGGTRYNNCAAQTPPTHADDKNFMWRSNDAVSFCTKGYDSFFYAYEETGDPRMAVALHGQTEYASRKIHVDQGECRNIGDVRDFMQLYRFTGHAPYRDNALRLFHELRRKQGADYLFSQDGVPMIYDTPFIDDDAFGYQFHFAKPYILGYALQGLPTLAADMPEEPGLTETIRAVAQFMAGAQDPAGGWRYPHPRSSMMIIDQGLEHAMQLTRAAAWLESRGDDITPYLDAIERALTARILGIRKTGAFLTGLRGWETSTDQIPEGKTLKDLYARPGDRDGDRDYREGIVNCGSASPDGSVHFSEVLDFYAKHREVAGLLNASEALTAILDRAKAATPLFPPPGYTPELLRRNPPKEYPEFGIEKGLPAFAPARIDQMTQAYTHQRSQAPDPARKKELRKKALDTLGASPPPPTDYGVAVLEEEDRGSYYARKIVFNLSEWYRVPAYLLVPKGDGPFPAVLSLHDHGAHFSIGKEKVVRPFGCAEAVRQDAQQWVDNGYGGRYWGDILAEKGHVVLAIDALFWGERGRREGPDYAAQEQLAANLFQLGMSWLGVITWDDLRSADFLATLPEVDPTHIAAVGLSVGSHRAWMAAALSDRIAAGIAVCWMGVTPVLMQPENNQTKGQSAFSMTAPGLRNLLDYPDVAALAAPKPMLFYSGSEDGLFPVEGVEAAWKILRQAYAAMGASDRLETRMWPTGHVFNVEMQEAAFTWLDTFLKK